MTLEDLLSIGVEHHADPAMNHLTLVCALTPNAKKKHVWNVLISPDAQPMNHKLL